MAILIAALGMAILIAALAADGDSEIRNTEQVDRGYEPSDERLRSHQPQAVSSPATFRREALDVEQVYVYLMQYCVVGLTWNRGALGGRHCRVGSRD